MNDKIKELENIISEKSTKSKELDEKNILLQKMIDDNSNKNKIIKLMEELKKKEMN